MQIANNRILDDEGRTLLLRGVNLGGSSKNPYGPPGWGMDPNSLKNPKNASFIGRPFQTEEIDSHFERLSKAGLTFLRLVITWEALEHAGPGEYDEAYVAYLRKLLLSAEKWGISVFLDPHQDVWSRWTGGDGAPAWTLEKLGIDLDKLDATAAAITRQHYAEFHNGASYPRMIWPGNYNRYAAATMFTLFYGGKTFAPNLILDNENIQDWLQNRYIAAFRHCFRRLKNCSAVAGWGIMNEPHYGLIGHKNLEQAEKSMVPVGPRPSPWDCIQAASGKTVKVPYYTMISLGRRSHKSEIFNPGAYSLFKPGYCCPWKQAGVWTDEGGENRLLRKDHFAIANGKPADFIEDFHKPFTLDFIEKMNEAGRKTFFFIEGLPPGTQHSAHPRWNKDDPPNVVHAFHWYDGFSLFTKQFRPWLTFRPENIQPVVGRNKVQLYFKECLEKGIAWSEKQMGNLPCLLGEFGLAFDINNRKAYKNGDYSMHEKALSMYYDAVDANLLHSTIWNYTPDNTNATGDDWNDEDLSIFSEGKERAAAGWKRPYPMATAGEPVAFSWNYKKGVARYRYKAKALITVPTIIYLPADWFGPASAIKSPLRFEYKHEEQRLLIYNDNCSGDIEVIIRRQRIA